MICEKCGTENKEGTSYCKKCGEDLIGGASEEVITAETAEDVATETEVLEEKKEAPAVTAEPKKEERVRTSPLAVRMQEKSLKEDKKIRKKLKRGKVWATIALLLAVMLIAENAVIIADKLGYLGDRSQPVEEVPPVTEVIEEIPVLGAEALAGDWNYTYTLKKNWDSDSSGDFETLTETITASGKAALINEGGNAMSAIVIPGKMVVDGTEYVLGDTPEAFASRYEEGFICIQMKGTEQKFFAPGGAEPLLIKIPVSMDAEGVITGGTYTHTYDKVVTEMSMRYEIEITFEK